MLMGSGVICLIAALRRRSGCSPRRVTEAGETGLCGFLAGTGPMPARLAPSLAAIRPRARSRTGSPLTVRAPRPVELDNVTVCLEDSATHVSTGATIIQVPAVRR
jgi:hypothetical protein